MFSINTLSYHVYYELYKQSNVYFGQFQGLMNQITLFHPGTAVMPPIKLKAFRCELTLNEWLSQSNQTLEIGGVTKCQHLIIATDYTLLPILSLVLPNMHG